jgi:integrase
VAGRTRRITIGRHGVLTADNARRGAVQHLAKVAGGENPSAERKTARAKARQTQTVEQLAKRFLSDYVEPRRKPSTAAEYRRILETRIPDALGKMPVDSVNREDIEALHLSLRTKPYEANRTLAVLSKMFNMAEVWRLRADGSNPVRKVERYTEKKRDRFLSEAELGRLGEVLAEAGRTQTEMPGVLAAIRLLSFTGCRAGEILNLRWSDVDLAFGVLRLPDAKAGARIVPLGAPAVDLLQAMPRKTGYVVTGKKRKKPLSLFTLESVWSRLRKKAKLDNARLHDLRHTVGTYAGQAGLNAFVVRDILGHKTLAMTDRYVSQDTNPLRGAADQVAGRIAAAFAKGSEQESTVAPKSRKRWGRDSKRG